MNPAAVAAKALQRSFAISGSRQRMPTLGIDPKRIRIARDTAKPARINRESRGVSRALSISQSPRRTRVRAGESVSRLLPVSSLSKPTGKTPTKNGPKASSSDASADGNAPTILRPERNKSTGPSAFRAAVTIDAAKI